MQQESDPKKASDRADATPAQPTVGDRARIILESITDAFFALGKDWRFNYVNPQSERILGLSPGDLLGKNIWEAYPGLVGSVFEPVYRGAMNECISGSITAFYPDHDRWYEVRAYPTPEGVSIYFRNVTEEKQAEATLRKSEEQRQLALDSAELGLWHLDPATMELVTDKRFRAIFGTTAERLDYEQATSVIHDEDRQRVKDTVVAATTPPNPPPYAIEYRVVHPDGSIRWVFAKGRANFSGGENTGLMSFDGTVADITDRKRAELTNSALAAIVESSDDAIISKNLNGIISSWNGGAERLFGYTASEAVGKSIMMLIPPDRLDEEPDIIGRIRRGERIDHYETIRRRKDGELLHISLTVSPMIDAHGQIVGASKIVRDITERKQHEQALRDARDAAEAANRSKDLFLAALSHELRTPLSPVLLTVSAMQANGSLPPDVHRHLDMIRRNVELEVRLIDDLLDVSKALGGKLRLNSKPTGVHGLLKYAHETCLSDLSQKKMSVVFKFAAKNDSVSADEARMQQVFWNLLKNAIKFGGEGQTIEFRTSNPEPDKIEIRIVDHGIGIPSDMLPRIFTAFDQGPEHTTERFGGLGLGLAIVRAVVELHSGTVRAESAGLGRGSSFIIQLPLTQSAVVSSAPQKLPSLSSTPAGLRVLIVEDHVDTADVLAMMLNLAGYHVATANTAGSALKAIAAQPFDVVVSDVGLPDSTGYELMREIRQRSAIKGIAMTGYGMEKDFDRSREAGFTAHVVKPIDLEQLERAIRRVVAADET